MKTLSFIVLMATALTMVSCGKNESGSSSSKNSSSPFTADCRPATRNGLITWNPGPYSNQYSIVVGGQTYPVNTQQNANIVSQAVQVAHSQNIPPVNGNQLKASITGSICNGVVGGTYNPTYPNQANNGLTLSQVVVYR